MTVRCPIFLSCPCLTTGCDNHRETGVHDCEQRTLRHSERGNPEHANTDPMIRLPTYALPVTLTAVVPAVQAVEEPAFTIERQFDGFANLSHLPAIGHGATRARHPRVSTPARRVRAPPAVRPASRQRRFSRSPRSPTGRMGGLPAAITSSLHSARSWTLSLTN